MNATLIVSIVIRLAALVWSLVLLRRTRDWRIALFAGMIALMALRQILSLYGTLSTASLSLAAPWDEVPALAVSVLALLALVFFGRMILEREQTNKALVRSDERFRNMFEAAPISIWEENWSAVKEMIDGLARRGIADWDKYFRDSPDDVVRAVGLVDTVAVNRATRDIYRAPDLDAIISFTRGKTMSAERLEIMRRQLVAFAGGRTSIAFDANEHRLDGAEIITRIRAVVPAEHRATWSLVLTTIEDITERERAKRRAVEAHERLIDAIESMPDGFALYDAEDRLVLCNTKYRELYDLSADLLIPGMRFEDHIRASAYRGQIADAVGREEEWVKERLEQHRNPKGTYEQRLGNGRWLLISERKTRDGGIVGVRGDITGVKAAQEALRERDARLGELRANLLHVSRLSAMAQLASALAHELNQPLTAIMNYLQAARREMEAGNVRVSGKTYGMMDKAIEQADRAAAIIRHLKIFIEKGETERFAEDINQVIEEASVLGLIGATERGIAVELKLGPHLPSVLIDKVQIQQVVLNLVRNSIEAMAESERRKVTIETSQEEEGWVLVAVRDTGSGLPEDVADQLFRPFVTTKAEGMGVGLSISRSIIDAHGGRLWATPNPGGGSVFQFTLPVAPYADKRHDR